MREELLNELMVISEEEKSTERDREWSSVRLYARESIGEIDRDLLLKQGTAHHRAPAQPLCGFPGAPAQLCGDHVLYSDHEPPFRYIFIVLILLVNPSDGWFLSDFLTLH